MNEFLNLFQSESLCKHDNCLVSSLRGLRNGMYYGGKVRFVHSLVMEILFSRATTIKEKIKNIIKPTLEHSLNLGVFVLIYKSIVCLLKRIFKSDNKLINFFAGIIGSYFMWTKYTPVNTQIMLYLLSRNLMAIAKIVNENYFPNFSSGFPIISMLVWGVVMYVFEYSPNMLQGSLKSSMNYIYKESDAFKHWTDFIPFSIPYFKGN
jgi:peroxisomal membrane protein 4